MHQTLNPARSTRLSAKLSALSMAVVALQAQGLQITNDGNAAIQALKDRLNELHETAHAIQAKADAEKRDLNADEQKELDACMAEFDEVEANIQRRERIMAQSGRLATPAPRAAAPAPAAQTPAPAPAAGRDGLRNTRIPTLEERQRWGFGNFGEFVVAVHQAALGRGQDARLQNAALSTYGNEGTGADGGFAVPPEWRAEIMKQVEGEDGLMQYVDAQPVSGNGVTYPVDETTAWGSGGIQAYWDGEADTMTQKKPSLKPLTVRLSRLTALVPVTDELLEDAPAMGSYVAGKSGEVITFKVNDGIVNGTGAGMPLGLLASPCKVTVNKETSQVAATVHANNVTNMAARMPARSFKRAIWLVNQDVWPQIMRLGVVVSNPAGTATGGFGALWMPPNGMANSGPFGTLLGRPIFVTEACQTLGTEGDIVLWDPKGYLMAMKSGGVRSDVSIHLWFDQNVTAFKFILRANGQPWLSAPISRKNGSNTLSTIVTLQTRS